MFRQVLAAVLLLTGAIGCDRKDRPPADKGGVEPPPRLSLVETRKGVRTQIKTAASRDGRPEDPPRDLKLVQYESPVGKLHAYVGVPKGPGRHPAIIWLVGGFSNGIGNFAWAPAPPENDQSAGVFRREGGIIMMYPSLRGGNDNPGVPERFFGEVDDVLAAADHLAKQDFVDPERIYLGGHSTGGTLALLVAACAGDRFRAVFALGPIDEVAGYGPQWFPGVTEPELKVRSPVHWLADIKCRTIVLEGRDGNSDAVEAMRAAYAGKHIAFHVVEETDHFSVILPFTRWATKEMLADRGATCGITLDDAEELAIRQTAVNRQR